MQGSAPSAVCSEYKRAMERSPLIPCVTIVVLQDDIDGALRDRRLRSRPATFCPVAPAACQTLGLALGNVRIGGNTLSIWGGRGMSISPSPPHRNSTEHLPGSTENGRCSPPASGSMSASHQCTESNYRLPYPTSPVRGVLLCYVVPLVEYKNYTLIIHRIH